MTAPANGREALVRRLHEEVAQYGVDCSKTKELAPRTSMVAVFKEIEALLTAPAEAPIGEVVIGPKGDVEGWTVVQWADRTPPVGTKLYTTPTRAEAEVRAIRAAAIEEARKILLDLGADNDEFGLHESEYDGLTYTLCSHCDYQDDVRPVHRADCPTRAARAFLAAHPAEPGKETGNV